MKQKSVINVLLMNALYVYMMLPIIIFLLGWCAWYIAIPGTVVFLICLVRIIKGKQYTLPELEWNKGDIEKVVLLVGIIALWVYFSGVGGFVWQNRDHLCRNAIFEILVEYDWPAVAEVVADEVEQWRGLTYYIGFWLPAAVIGKMFGVTVGYCFMALWAVLGICLFYYLICVIQNKIQIWPLIVFIFMSGGDILGYCISFEDLSMLSGTAHIEWWSSRYQFSSFTTQLFFVFNQAIPAWLIIMLMYIQKNNRNLVLIWGCALLPCTLPFVGMLPFIVCFLLCRKYEGVKYGTLKWWKEFGKDTFTFENILGGGVAGIVSFVYLISNVSGQNIEYVHGSVYATATSDVNNTRAQIMVWILFIIIEVGVYWLAIYKYKKKDVLFYILLIWLCICPFIRVGSEMDFCMRASIPALVLLYVFVVKSIQNAWLKRDYLIIVGLVVLLLIGSKTVTNEFRRTISETVYRLNNNLTMLDDRASDMSIFNGNNFSCNIDDSLFFKYCARK